jgi:S1-C subfamily serine protease
MTDGTDGTPGHELPPPGGTPPPAWQPTMPVPQVPTTPNAGGWSSPGSPAGPPPMPPAGPPPGQYGQPGGYGGAPPVAPAKSKKPLLIGGGLAAVLLAGGIGFAATRGDDKPATATTIAAVTTLAPTTTAGEETTTTPTTPPPADIDTIAKSVVQITAIDANGDGLWTGSGTIISADGLILTNAHVVENSDELRYATLEVSITDSADTAPVPTYLVDVVAFDPSLDLAVVKISALTDGTPTEVTDAPFIPVGDSDAIGLGDELRIFGYPGIGGDTITYTEGSVAGFTSEAGIDDERAWVKTDATIAGGNSGGTAVNDAGELIAVPTRASATDGDVADCRVVQDTNGDNIVDENDSCIPIGGFINGLRPTNLAAALIEQAQLGEIVSTEVVPQTDVDTTSIFATAPVFSADVAEDDTPTEVVQQLPSGAVKVCGFFDYEGMTDGLPWDAVWSIDGEFNADYSMVAEEWIGGAEGSNWWVCAGNGETALPEGSYELSIYVGDGLISSNTVFVGDAYVPVSINVINGTAGTVCYLRLSPAGAQNWGPDELGADITIDPGVSVPLTVIGAVYDVLAEDCDTNTLVETYGVDLTGGGDITLTP